MYSVAAVRADAFIGEKRLLTYAEQIAFLRPTSIAGSCAHFLMRLDFPAIAKATAQK
jgi:hypothetical protein